MTLITTNNPTNETEYLQGASIGKIISDTTAMIGTASSAAITYAAEIASQQSAEFIAKRASELISLERADDAAKLITETQDLIQAGHRAMLITLKKTAVARIPEFTDATIDDSEEVKSLKDQLAKLKEQHNESYEKHVDTVNKLEQQVENERNAYNSLKTNPETVELQRKVTSLEAKIKDDESVGIDLKVARNQLADAQNTISNKQREIEGKIRAVESAKAEMVDSKSRYDENRRDFILSDAEKKSTKAQAKAKAEAIAKSEYPLSRFLAEHDMSVTEGEKAANAVNAPLVDKDIQRIGEVIYFGTDDTATVATIRTIVKQVIDSLEYKETAERYKDLTNDWNSQIQRMAEQATS